jgi:hypothetical protein
MRPTFEEQLHGIRRILADVVAPEVTAPYPADMLRGALAALDTLERALPALAPFLEWDNDAMTRLLTRVDPHHPLVAAPAQGDVTALNARNEAMRSALAEAVPRMARDAASDEATAALYADLRAHLRERMDRYPFTATASLPAR